MIYFLYGFRFSEKIDGLIKLLSNEFGRKMRIESTVHEESRMKKSTLRQHFREEKVALHDLATSLRTEICDETEAHRKFMNAQHKTDIDYLEIIKSK